MPHKKIIHTNLLQVFDGIVTITSNTTLSTVATNVLTAAPTALTVGSSAGFAIKDRALLIQMVGTLAGTNEVVKITAISGSVLTMTTILGSVQAIKCLA